jgi:hypothetical protein
MSPDPWGELDISDTSPQAKSNQLMSELEQAEQHDAASRIQAVQRGYAVRSPKGGGAGSHDPFLQDDLETDPFEVESLQQVCAGDV